MKFSTVSLHADIVRDVLSVALAIGALTAMSTRAHAEELDPITITGPTVKTIGHDPATWSPIEDVSVEAHIAVDAETLRNDSGVVLLNDRVREAAFKVCNKAEKFTVGDEECMHNAIKAAQPQVDAAIKQARSG